MKTTALVASLIANIALIAFLIRQPAAVGPEAELQPTVTPPSMGSLGVEGSSTPVAMRERLAAAGFSEDAIKPMLLGWLEARAREETPFPASGYWRAEADSTAAVTARERQLDSVRRGLLEAYGENALEDNAFAQVVMLQRAAAMRSSQVLQTPVGGVDDTTRFESDLRESPLAAQLRSSGVDFTEEEFRHTFRVIRDFQANPSPEKLVEHRNGVRAVLGRDRALRVAASNDPGFRVIQEVSDRHRLSPDTAFAAYEIILDAQERMIGIIQTGANDLRRAEDIRLAIESRDRRLSELLGETVSHELLAAQATRMRSNAPNARAIN